MISANISVLMPCLNAGPFLEASVASVLQQPECLELLIADGGSSDGSLAQLSTLAAIDSRIRIVSRSDSGPADALNKAFQASRGTYIGWLNADDIYTPGSLARSSAFLDANPNYLMVYGEGEEFNEFTQYRNRYPTLPPHLGIDSFHSHCFICQPSVLFRRSMVLLLGPFDTQWKTAFDFDYWLRAFDAFPSRIGYIPHLQGRTRLHENTITSKQRAQVALEATALIAKNFGSAKITRLENLGIELQLGIASTNAGETHTEFLRAVSEKAAPWLSPQDLQNFRLNWNLVSDEIVQSSSSYITKNESNLKHSLSLRLLQALYPDLRPEAPGSPLDRKTRLHKTVALKRDCYRMLKENFITYDPPRKSVSFHPRDSRFPFGVNLIGHAFDVFGIGEDIRMAALALQAAKIPFCVINHPARNGSSTTDRTLESFLCRYPSGGQYSFNLVCLAAPIHARWLLESGLDVIYDRYTIAAWPWETRQWPDAWSSLIDVVDEIWPSSNFTAEAFRSPATLSNVPVNVIPMAAQISDPNKFMSTSSRYQKRAELGIPSTSVVFCYCFDLNSTATRKNPMAVLETFQQAFPLPELLSTKGLSSNSHHLSKSVALVIKTFVPRTFSQELFWLQLRAKEDPRIHLVEATLSRDELLSIYGACDVFLSLHRSEGFGRSLAEALQLGLDVIATDYGGNTDFCVGPLCHQVSFAEVPIPRGSYPCADGHKWAEPDLDHAAELMHKVAERRVQYFGDSSTLFSDISRDPSILSFYRDLFSFAEAGSRYKNRLYEIWNQ